MKRALSIPLMILLVVVLAGALGFAGCSTPAPTPAPAPTPTPTPTPTPAPAQAIKIKLGYDTPPTTALGAMADYFAKTVPVRTNGRITVDTYPSGTLSTMGSSLKSLRAGVADAYILGIGALPQDFPASQCSALPGLSFFPDGASQLKAEAATFRSFVTKYSSMAKEWNGLQMLFAGQYTSAVLMGKGNTIRVPADMNGMKVGATGMAQDVVTACGGVPVFMIPPDMYQDLQTGVVSDALVAWGAAMDWQLQEQTKWVLDITFGGGEMSGVMNAQTWNKISPQDQQILTQVGAETEQVDFNFILNQVPAARQKWAAAGIPIITPTAAEMQLWTDKFQAQWNKYKDTNRAAGATDIDDIFNAWKAASEKATAAP